MSNKKIIKEITKDFVRFKYMLLHGDSSETLKKIPDGSIHCGITSPPYWEQRDYGVEGQLGREENPIDYIEKMVAIFKEVKRVLRDDAVFWLNIGDGYCKKDIDNVFLKQKDLVGMPWIIAFALRKDGWFIRSDVIWEKLNPMPESVNDRPSKSYEHIFLLSKSKKYFYDSESIKDMQKEISIRRAFSVNNVEKRKDFDNPNYAISGKSQEKTYQKMREKIDQGELMRCNKRDVWKIATSAKRKDHFAVFPEELVETCVKAGTSFAGCCSVCGKPFKRISNIKATSKNEDQYEADQKVIIQDNIDNWDFSCNCKGRERIPSIVLDPFNGSGTTGSVCCYLDRYYVGSEISPEYISLTRDILFKNGGGIAPPEVTSFKELLE